jgi:NAD(P)-dependent dehydrogenase (short-subunit alcohol dehydrogenase family)
MKRKTWLVTGSAGGLGGAIAGAVLLNGDNLVATARNVERLATLKDAYGDRVSIVPLDVTNAPLAKAAVLGAVDHFGSLDVLVNNAGYSLTAAFEQTSEEDFHAQIATNFFGVVNLMRAVVPLMRRQRSGHIINVSSASGRMGMASQSAYSAAKFAVSGLTEAVAQEVASFGVKVIAVEPGSMRTNFGKVSLSGAHEPISDYDSSAGAFRRILQAIKGKEIGDIDKIAQVIIGLSRRDELPTHLILGSDALAFIQDAESRRSAATAAWQPVSKSIDADDADLSWLATIA